MVADLEPPAGERSRSSRQHRWGSGSSPWSPRGPREGVRSHGGQEEGATTKRACCGVLGRAALVHPGLARAACPLSSPLSGELPWPSRERRPVCAAAGPGEVKRGCGSMPANSARPTKRPHFRTFPALSILLHVFQNCPRLYMPWREINFQCNTHREIHVQNMFFWCQKKNNK